MLDPRFPDPLLPELDLTIFVDSNHSYDMVTGKAITDLLGFVASILVEWLAQRQASIQTATFWAELQGLKIIVEKVVAIRYYLRSMGVSVTKPTIIFYNNKVVDWIPYCEIA